MNTPNQEPQPLLDTLPQDIEQGVVPPVADGDVSEPALEEIPKAKAKTKVNTHKNPPRKQPPEVLGVFLGEEDRRMLKKMNQIMAKKLGIKKNNSFRI